MAEMVNPKSIRGTAIERFYLQVDTTGECWIWLGHTDKKGYARFKNDDLKSVAVHRWSYEKWVGEIPEGMVIDHKCFNPRCQNPKHLRTATQEDNTVKYGRTNAAFVNANKSVCNSGHPLTGENLRLEVKRNGKIVRRCKKCHALKIHKWRAKNG